VIYAPIPACFLVDGGAGTERGPKKRVRKKHGRPRAFTDLLPGVWKLAPITQSSHAQEEGKRGKKAGTLQGNAANMGGGGCGESLRRPCHSGARQNRSSNRSKRIKGSGPGSVRFAVRKELCSLKLIAKGRIGSVTRGGFRLRGGPRGKVVKGKKIRGGSELGPLGCSWGPKVTPPD